MIKKLMRHSAAAAGFAALLLVGACAHNDGLDDTTDVTDQVVQVRPEEAGVDATVAPAPGPAKVDSDGNVYASSAAPGRGNTGGIGTNTNVNVIPEKSTAEVTGYTDRAPIVPDTTIDTTATMETTTPMTTTTTIETTTVPMTSSVQESTTTPTTDDDDDEEPAPARTRMRKD